MEAKTVFSKALCRRRVRAAVVVAELRWLVGVGGEGVRRAGGDQGDERAGAGTFHAVGATGVFPVRLRPSRVASQAMGK